METPLVKEITEQDILDRLRDGSLRVNVRTARVSTYSKVVGVLGISVSETRTRDRREVRFRSNSILRRFALHRLVWMAGSMNLIPRGFDVTHKDLDAHYVDGINNLELKEIDD